MLFLVGVFIVLLIFVFGVGWLGTTYVFGKLEPAFIGALVGAAGTIFAACIAYTAASQNLEMVSRAADDNAKQRLENEKQQKRFQVEQAMRELQASRDTLAFADRFLAQFDGAAETGQRDYVAFLNDVFQTGGVIQNMGMMTEPFGGRVREILTRFQMMQGSINVVTNRPADQAINERATINRAIRDRLAEVRTLRGQIDEDLRRRERDVDALARQPQ